MSSFADHRAQGLFATLHITWFAQIYIFGFPNDPRLSSSRCFVRRNRPARSRRWDLGSKGTCRCSCIQPASPLNCLPVGEASSLGRLPKRFGYEGHIFARAMVGTFRLGTKPRLRAIIRPTSVFFQQDGKLQQNLKYKPPAWRVSMDVAAQLPLYSSMLCASSS